MKVKNILAIIALLILIIDAIVENTMNISMPLSVDYIIRILLSISFIYILIIIIIFIVNKCVSSNDSIKKFKYRPVNLKYDDVMLWLEKENVPNTLYLKGTKKEFIKLEIQFSTIGKNGPFVDKGIFLDNKEFTIDEIRIALKEEIYLEDQQCILMGYTENNDPSLFLKVLEELKNS
ncbi:MAG: hypothetical protein NC310_09190 [Roseburia sp.]|nr:hypothetical protein [Roseburia sp.]MCM1557160.1 hypothetical protein [Anaeroplasma bactoclasticum]